MTLPVNASYSLVQVYRSIHRHSENSDVDRKLGQTNKCTQACEQNLQRQYQKDKRMLVNDK